jgi:hypothetical protein
MLTGSKGMRVRMKRVMVCLIPLVLAACGGHRMMSNPLDPNMCSIVKGLWQSETPAQVAADLRAEHLSNVYLRPPMWRTPWPGAKPTPASTSSHEVVIGPIHRRSGRLSVFAARSERSAGGARVSGII